MSDPYELARAFYLALEKRDVPALLALLHPAFEGEVTAGLPHGFGGVYRGPREMLHLWGRVSERLPMHPRPDEIVATTDGRVLVVGKYTAKGLDAAFAHLLTFRDGQLAHLVQITDSALWRDAMP